MALIAVLAAVAVPGSVGSRVPSPEAEIDPNLFRPVEVASVRGTTMTIPVPDPAYRSDGALDTGSVLLDPDQRPDPAGRPDAAAIQPEAPTGVVVIPQWRLDRNVSWYGPGFYGKRTACGHAYTESIIGVAHKTLPCGTKVKLRYRGRSVTVPVIDRGPYVPGRDYDLTEAVKERLRFPGVGTVLATR